MKRYFIVVLILFICIAGYAQQELYSETRTVDQFDRVTASRGIEVIIDEGESSTITVETNDLNALNRIETVVRDGTLEINIGHGIRPKNLTARVTISASQLSCIRSSSGASICTMGTLTGDNIEVSAGSGSHINLNLDAGIVECNSSAGSMVRLSGKTKNMEAHAGSGGVVEANELVSEKAYATASAGGITNLNVNDELAAKASSGGSVVYTGEATITSKRQSGGGSIRKE